MGAAVLGTLYEDAVPDFVSVEADREAMGLLFHTAAEAVRGFADRGNSIPQDVELFTELLTEFEDWHRSVIRATCPEDMKDLLPQQN